MKAFLKVGKEMKAASAKLTNVLAIVFVPASAKASVSGENRGQAASAFANALPGLMQAFGKIDAFVIELENKEGTVITVKNDDIPNRMKLVTDAYNRMEALREALEGHEKSYKEIRESIDLTPGDKKARGRHAKELDYASGLV